MDITATSKVRPGRRPVQKSNVKSATPATTSKTETNPSDRVDLKWTEGWISGETLRGNFGSAQVGLAAKYRNDGFGFGGKVDGKDTNLSIRNTGEKDQAVQTGKADGQWAGEKVDMDLRVQNSGVDMDGKVGGKPVSLDLDRTDTGYNVSGNWKGSDVRVGVTAEDECTYKMDGKWGDSKVDLTQNECTGEVTGQAPREMMLPWMVGDFTTPE